MRCRLNRSHPRGQRHDALLSGLSPVKLAGDPALLHDDDPVAEPKNLQQIGGNHHDAGTLPRKLAQESVDLAARSDVDALRRLVSDQQAGLDTEPRRQQHLLLVAA